MFKYTHSGREGLSQGCKTERRNLAIVDFVDGLFFMGDPKIIRQASTLTQNDAGPVGPVTPSIYWSAKCLLVLHFFLNITRKNIA